MATTSDYVGILKVAIHLQEGDTKTIKVWRFDGDQLPGYTRERVEQEILDVDEVKSAALASGCICMSVDVLIT